MSLTSGWLASMERAICFIIVVLPALGGETIRPRWPFPIGEIRSMIRAVMLVGSSACSSLSRSSGNSGVRSSNSGAGLGLLRVHAVDRVDPQQGRVLLVAVGRPAGAVDAVALAHAELAGLLHRDVDVVLGRQGALEAQEAVALVAQVEAAVDLDRLAVALLRRAALSLALPCGCGPSPALRLPGSASTLACRPPPSSAGRRSPWLSWPRPWRGRCPGSPPSSPWLVVPVPAAGRCRCRRCPPPRSPSVRLAAAGPAGPAGLLAAGPASAVRRSASTSGVVGSRRTRLRLPLGRRPRRRGRRRSPWPPVARGHGARAAWRPRPRRGRRVRAAVVLRTGQLRGSGRRARPSWPTPSVCRPAPRAIVGELCGPSLQRRAFEVACGHGHSLVFTRVEGPEAAERETPPHPGLRASRPVAGCPHPDPVGVRRCGAPRRNWQQGTAGVAGNQTEGEPPADGKTPALAAKRARGPGPGQGLRQGARRRRRRPRDPRGRAGRRSSAPTGRARPRPC